MVFLDKWIWNHCSFFWSLLSSYLEQRTVVAEGGWRAFSYFEPAGQSSLLWGWGEVLQIDWSTHVWAWANLCPGYNLKLGGGWQPRKTERTLNSLAPLNPSHRFLRVCWLRDFSAHPALSWSSCSAERCCCWFWHARKGELADKTVSRGEVMLEYQS